MSTRTYNKLVRDKIPEIIRNQGEEPLIGILDEEEYKEHLNTKLDEEISEYRENKDIEEMADVLEVLFALNEAEGHTKEELFSVYEQKHKERGGFSDRIFLISKTEAIHPKKKGTTNNERMA